MWNAISLVQDLNTCRRVHFRRRLQLHHGHLQYRSLCVILLDRCWVVHIRFIRIVKFNFLHISQWITLPTQSCLVLYSFCANLLHSLIMWLMVSSRSLHNLHLQFFCFLCILALICLVLMALFWAALWRDFVSLLKFPFLTQVQVLSGEMLFISRLKCP